MKRIIFIITYILFVFSTMYGSTRIELYNMGLTSETCFAISIQTADRVICNSESDKHTIVDSKFINSLFIKMDSLVEDYCNINPDIRAVMRIYQDSYLHETIYFNSDNIIRGSCIYMMSEDFLNTLYGKLGDLD